MTDPNNPQAPPPAGPPPSYDEVQAMSGGTPGYPVGQPAQYPSYPPQQDGFKYDGTAPYPAQPGYPGYPGQPGQVPYPTQPGVQYPYGAPQAPGMYPQPPPGSAVYNPQGGVTILNRNADQERMMAVQRRKKMFFVFFVFIAISIFIYIITRWIF